jgi:hypothetical protein
LLNIIIVKRKSNKKLNEPISKMLLDPNLRGKDIAADILTSPIKRVSNLKLLVDGILKTIPSDQSEVILEGKNLSKKIELVCIKRFKIIYIKN